MAGLLTGAMSAMRLVAFGFFTLFGVVWTAISVYVLARSRRSESWSRAVGTVVSTEVKRVHSGNPSTGTGSLTYEPSIQYEYSVGGSKYANATYAMAPLPWTADPAPADAIVKQHPVGGQVTVFYDPSNPGDSALVAGTSRGNWYFLLMGAVFVAAGLLGLFGRW